MPELFNYVWLIPCLPLLGAIANLFFNRRTRRYIRGASEPARYGGAGAVPRRQSDRSAGIVACIVVAASFLVTLITFANLLRLPSGLRFADIVVYSWITSGNFSVDVGFLIDPLSMVMMLVVTGVGLLIHVYSIGYMKDDPSYIRFFIYMNLFMFAMLILVMADNFLLMFVGWEGVGLCSYLLIGFWCERQTAADAAIKAFVVNRIGDFAFVVGLLLIFIYTGSLAYTEVFGASATTVMPVTAVTLLLFVGAIGKSAQVPLHIWLPDAMEGPTPVSALIHAATMVTAGVYMVARCQALFLMAPVSMGVVTVVGAFTAIFAASIGLTQYDIKRVLAYSTVSQLGYMFLACGVGAFAAAIFHLFTHAFFKALLFMGAGSVIHALTHAFGAGKDPQDLRNMGGLKAWMPKTYVTMFIATLAIAGIFPFAGFFSKDAILWGAFLENKPLWIIGVVTAFMTSLYMFRLLFLTFHGNTRLKRQETEHVRESPGVMVIPLILLAILSTVGGFIGIPIIEGGNRFGAFLGPVLGFDVTPHSIYSEFGTMAVSLGIALAGIAFAHLLYVGRNTVPGHVEPAGIHKLLFHKYYVDEIYQAGVVKPFQTLAWGFWRILDAVAIDGVVTASALVVRGVGSGIRYLQTGVVQNYALIMVVGAVIMVWVFVF